MKAVLVTGGCGFIGSAFIRHLLNTPSFSGRIVNLDKMTYASDRSALHEVEDSPRYVLHAGDIADAALLEFLQQEYAIDAVVHFAAESHVDRSIEGPEAFVHTNVVGTYVLLEHVRKYPHIRFHHVSTDEVYGSLSEEGLFSETSRYAPNSPYSASKAASDHFVRAYGKTYDLRVTISHCGNNYGPFQHREKFIPVVIDALMHGKTIPLYGDGSNVRDWIYVDDHVRALWAILQKGTIGQVYTIGSGQERSNKALVDEIIEVYPGSGGEIAFVEDRKGHDFRYALDSTKIANALGFRPQVGLREGLEKTVAHYLARRTKRIACVIPARLHSTRFPKKILHEIHGKPLIQRSYEAAVATGMFDEVVLAIDAEETRRVVAGFTSNYIMTSSECSCGTERLLELFARGKRADVWVNWQCDEPLISRGMICDLLQGIERQPAIWTLKKKSDDTKMLEQPSIVTVATESKHRVRAFSRANISPWRHIGIYAYAEEVLEQIAHLSPSSSALREKLEQLTYLEAGIPIYAYPTKFETVGVDLLEDIERLSTQLAAT